MVTGQTSEKFFLHTFPKPVGRLTKRHSFSQNLECFLSVEDSARKAS